MGRNRSFLPVHRSSDQSVHYLSFLSSTDASAALSPRHPPSKTLLPIWTAPPAKLPGRRFLPRTGKQQLLRKPDQSLPQKDKGLRSSSTGKRHRNPFTMDTNTTTNPRGIPSFPFLSNVNEYVKSLADVEATLTRFQEMVSKYTFMQQNVERRAVGLREKLPEMKRTLEVVRFLKKKRGDTSTASQAAKTGADGLDDEDLDELDLERPKKHGIETTFSLQDTLYAKATIKPAEIDEVYLWLGANVMVAYPLDEAEELLQGKLDKAKESLVAAEEDLEFLRVQITTLEVAIARVHNWDVGEKRKLRSQGKLPDKDGEDDKGKDKD